MLETKAIERGPENQVLKELHGEKRILLNDDLGHDISDESVGNILRRHGIEPAPDRERSTSWSMFIKAHWDVLAAIDFTTIEVWTKRGLVTYYLLFVIMLFCIGCTAPEKSKDLPLNILIATLDDMGYGTTGVEGCMVPGISPNIDKLALEGILFTHGFVMSSTCGPSRSAILSGRYPHCNGVMGHGNQPPPLWQQPDVVTPTVTKYPHDMGYTTGAILKNSWEINNVWDTRYSELPFGVGFHDRNPNSFYERTKAFIAAAKDKKKPFFLYANPIDPHWPWVDTPREKLMQSQWNQERPYPAPSLEYSPDEVEFPHFLSDLPEIRKNLIPYYESLHRGDECIGGILRALKESGEEENTLVFFLSDHGMGAIGAKATLYHDGLRTPVIVRWPGRIEKGSVDEESIQSSISLPKNFLI